MKIEDLLDSYNRIFIFGPPKTGKTTLSSRVTDRKVIHADDWIDVPWKEQPSSIIKYCQPLPRYCLEGCLVARALRKGLETDCVIVLSKSHIELTPAQANFGKQVMSIFNEWKEKNPRIPVFYY